MPTYVSGTRGTGSVESTRRKYSVHDKLWMVSPEYAALAFFARSLKKEAVTDPEYRWFEKEQPSRQDAINYSTGYNTTATELTVDDGTKFRAGDVVQNVDTGEHMHVDSVASDVLTVDRGWGSTAAAAITDNDVLVITGNANAEGASLRAALTTKAEKKFNYTQIFREPLDVTGTEAATDLYAGGSDIDGLRKEHNDVHMKDIERSFLFGEKKEDTSGSQPVRATGGLNSFLSTNVTSDSNGTITESEWDTVVRGAFQNGGDKKMGILSPLMGSAIESWAKTKLYMYPTDKTYGIAIRSYLSIHGTIDFTLERILAENTVWAGYSFLTDMDKIGYRYLAGNGQNRDTRLLKDRQDNGDDQLIEEYMTEAGFFLAVENRHAVLKGVTAYS